MRPECTQARVPAAGGKRIGIGEPGHRGTRRRTGYRIGSRGTRSRGERHRRRAATAPAGGMGYALAPAAAARSAHSAPARSVRPKSTRSASEPCRPSST